MSRNRTPDKIGTPLAATAACLTLLATAACASDPAPSASGSPSSTPTATSAPTGDATPTLEPSATPSPATAVQVVEVTVARGKVRRGPTLVEVKKGAVVRLELTSDVTDEIHLHTYDLSTSVKAGVPTSLTFKATIAGTFEVELEKRGLRLTRFRVR